MVALPPMGDPIQTAGAKGQGASQKTAKLPSDTMQTGRDESTGDTATNYRTILRIWTRARWTRSTL